MITDPSSYQRPATDDELCSDFGKVLSHLSHQQQNRLCALLAVHAGSDILYKVTKDFLKVETQHSQRFRKAITEDN